MDAIQGEKPVIRWRRAWKIELIDAPNIDWTELLRVFHAAPLG